MEASAANYTIFVVALVPVIVIVEGLFTLILARARFGRKEKNVNEYFCPVFFISIRN